MPGASGQYLAEPHAGSGHIENLRFNSGPAHRSISVVAPHRIPSVPHRAARAALAAHFTPDQLAADPAQFSAEEVWEQRGQRDGSGRPAHDNPRDELANAQLTAQFVIPSDKVCPATLAGLTPSCPLGLWMRGHNRLPQLTASAVAVTGNRAASEQAITRVHAFATAAVEAGHTSL
ncbi:hypothetical protein ACFV7R_45830 [Streptomyces sp. NPDC059866]|uniref:hypothetical protein n=1 Tax=Streptomyces sp. NPDC059866 TaxID=3346978 RepID=UPI00364C8B93